MDIESKRWRLRSDGFGGALALCKRTGIQVALERSDLPSESRLALMKESTFDSAIRAAVESL